MEKPKDKPKTRLTIDLAFLEEDAKRHGTGSKSSTRRSLSEHSSTRKVSITSNRQHNSNRGSKNDTDRQKGGKSSPRKSLSMVPMARSTSVNNLDKQPVSSRDNGNKQPDTIRTDLEPVSHRSSLLLDGSGKPNATFKDRFAMYKQQVKPKEKKKVEEFRLYVDPPWLIKLGESVDDRVIAYIRNVQELRTMKSAPRQVLIPARIEQVKEMEVNIVHLPVIKDLNVERSNSRKYSLGIPQCGEKQKNVLLMATDAITTAPIIDGVVNYILGINWNDGFRLAISNPEDHHGPKKYKEKEERRITTYSIPSTNKTKLPFALNIVQTPTIENAVVDKEKDKTENAICQMKDVKQFLSNNAEHGVDCVHAVCLVTKANKSKINPRETVMRQHLIEWFGDEFEANICHMEYEDAVSDEDSHGGRDLAEVGSTMPYITNLSFDINNKHTRDRSAKNTNNESKANKAKIIDENMWNSGTHNWDKFFGNVNNAKPASLTCDTGILLQKEKLQEGLSHLKILIKDGCQKLQCFTKEQHLVSKHAPKVSMPMKDVKDFSYELFEAEKIKRELPYCGEQVTNCSVCSITCHENCAIADDDKKHECVAMVAGYCRVCPGKCKWDQHFNKSFVFYLRMQKKSKKFSEISSSYRLELTEEAEVGKLTGALHAIYTETKEDLERNISKAANAMDAIRLIDGTENQEDYIDVAIHEEMRDGEPNWKERIRILRDLKNVDVVLKLKGNKKKK